MFELKNEESSGKIWLEVSRGAWPTLAEEIEACSGVAWRDLRVPSALEWNCDICILLDARGYLTHLRNAYGCDGDCVSRERFLAECATRKPKKMQENTKKSNIIVFRKHSEYTWESVLQRIESCSDVVWRNCQKPTEHVPEQGARWLYLRPKEGEISYSSGEFAYDNPYVVDLDGFLRACMESRPKRAQDGTMQTPVSRVRSHGSWQPTRKDYRECCGMWCLGRQKLRIDAQDLLQYDSRESFDRARLGWWRLEAMPPCLIPEDQSYEIRFPLLMGER